MGELKSDEKKAHTIIVKNVGKSNLEILDLQVFNSAFQFSHLQLFGRKMNGRRIQAFLLSDM